MGLNEQTMNSKRWVLEQANQNFFYEFCLKFYLIWQNIFRLDYSSYQRCEFMTGPFRSKWKLKIILHEQQ